MEEYPVRVKEKYEKESLNGMLHFGEKESKDVEINGKLQVPSSKEELDNLVTFDFDETRNKVNKTGLEEKCMNRCDVYNGECQKEMIDTCSMDDSKINKNKTHRVNSDDSSNFNVPSNTINSFTIQTNDGILDKKSEEELNSAKDVPLFLKETDNSNHVKTLNIGLSSEACNDNGTSDYEKSSMHVSNIMYRSNNNNRFVEESVESKIQSNNLINEYGKMEKEDKEESSVVKRRKLALEVEKREEKEEEKEKEEVKEEEEEEEEENEEKEKENEEETIQSIEDEKKGKYLQEKLELLLTESKRYTEKLVCQRLKLKSSKKDKNRRTLLTEKEEDDLLLQDATEEDDTIIIKQPIEIKGSMKSYQIEGLNWLYQLYRFGINGILADEMGLGKTLQTISLLCYLRFQKNIKRKSIIICPRSTLDNWCEEIQKWCPAMKFFKYYGNKDQRKLLNKKVVELDYDILLTTYEIVIKDKSCLYDVDWFFLVIDEAHRIKNEKSVLSTSVRFLKSEKRLLITGTPLHNNLKELWSLLNFLMPKIFDNSEEFDNLFNISKFNTNDNKQSEIITQLHAILKPFMLRRLKVEVEQSLPPKREIYVFVGMSKLQKKLYSDILSKNIDVLNAMTGSKNQMLNILMQLRKCCNHPYLFDGIEEPPYIEGNHLIETSGKMSLLDKLLPRLKKENSRVLLFSQMTRLLDIIDDYCRWKKYEYLRIDGSTDGDERQIRINQFNAPNSKYFIFLLSTRAGGIGINLTSADIVILFDSDYNPQMDIQAMDRAHRIGQKKNVIVYRFVTQNSVEEKIVERAAKKLKLDSLIIQKGKLNLLNSGQKDQNKQELHDILSFGAPEVYKTQDVSSISDEDINIILADAEKRTKEIENKLSNLEKTFDLKNLSLDGGLNMYNKGKKTDGSDMTSSGDSSSEYSDESDEEDDDEEEDEDTEENEEDNDEVENEEADEEEEKEETFDDKEGEGENNINNSDSKEVVDGEENEENENADLTIKKKKKKKKKRKKKKKGGKIRKTIKKFLKHNKKNLTFLDLGERKSKWKIMNTGNFKVSKNRKSLKGWRAEARGGHDFQFFNNDRLDEIEKLEGRYNNYLANIEKINAIIESQREVAAFKKIPVLNDFLDGHAKNIYRIIRLVDPTAFPEKSMEINKEGEKEKEYSNSEYKERIKEILNKNKKKWGNLIKFKEKNVRKCYLLVLEYVKKYLLGIKLEGGFSEESHGKVEESQNVNGGIGSKEAVDEEEDIVLIELKNIRREKEKLLNEGFANWNRAEFNKLMNALTIHGSDDIDFVYEKFFSNTKKSFREVQEYVKAFFEKFDLIKGGIRLYEKIQNSDYQKRIAQEENDLISNFVEEQLENGVKSIDQLKLPENLPYEKYEESEKDLVDFMQKGKDNEKIKSEEVEGDTIEISEEERIQYEKENQILLWLMYQHGVVQMKVIHYMMPYYWSETINFFKFASSPYEKIESRCRLIINAINELNRKNVENTPTKRKKKIGRR